ncbi:MAG TPA: RsmE family RNA methyltransferase [Thermoanaerobaculia bacterium]|nr:RsmE family RNA methyltransferase [Thermoanaerobaculia bacterium]
MSPPALPGEPANRVVVALACAEPARIEWAVEKGTECGAAGFALLACERSQKAHVAALSSPARLERLRRIAVEATKQCDRTIVPFVEGPKSTEEFLRRLRGARLIVADPGGATIEDGPVPSRRTRVLFERSEFTREGEGAPAGRDRVLAIGPEGGFAPAEISLFEENLALFFSLGPRILRLETAVVVALAKLVDPA